MYKDLCIQQCDTYRIITNIDDADIIDLESFCVLFKMC